jgi:DNA-binding response OmpR family regulator
VRALTLLGYSVDGAASGDEAVRLLKHSAYDLMVLDMQMPGLDGVEVMRRARKLHPALLIIILTGHATLENAIAAVKLDAVDYLRKPVSVHEVVDAVARTLEENTRRLQREHLLHAVVEAVDELREDEAPQPSSSIHERLSQEVIFAPPLTLDRQMRLVAVGDDPVRQVQLTEGETEILAGLMTNPNRILSCSRLADIARGQHLSEREAESLVRPYIFRLRQKLEADPKQPRLIRTVRGKGYLFVSSDGNGLA